MKQKAYQSTLKSRALQVLVYLIDRSNKEGTCFPAITTMSWELHISVSTVKRALRELVDSGFIKKESRFREKNKGQTSNLYILCFLEENETSIEENEIGKSKNDLEDLILQDQVLIHMEKQIETAMEFAVRIISSCRRWVKCIYITNGVLIFYSNIYWPGEGGNLIPP